MKTAGRRISKSVRTNRRPERPALEHYRAAKVRLSKWLLHSDGGCPADGRRPPNPHPLDNVVGVGIGEQTTAGRPTGRRTLKIYVEKKFPISEISPADRLPATFAGLTVDVEESGLINLFHASAPAPPGGPRALRPGEIVRIRSRNHTDDCLVTLGGFVQSGSRVFGLSTAHGAAECGNAAMYALADTHDEEAATLAELHRATPLTDCTVVDGSTWAIRANRSLQKAIPAIGLPAGIEHAAVKMAVHKYGGASGYTVGCVLSIDADIRACAAGRTLLLRHQLLIGPASPTQFAVPGDSGSLIVNRDTDKAVGLLVAGSHGLGVASHVQDVLDALGVRLLVGNCPRRADASVQNQNATRPVADLIRGNVPASGVLFTRLAP